MPLLAHHDQHPSHLRKSLWDTGRARLTHRPDLVEVCCLALLLCHLGRRMTRSLHRLRRARHARSSVNELDLRVNLSIHLLRHPSTPLQEATRQQHQLPPVLARARALLFFLPLDSPLSKLSKIVLRASVGRQEGARKASEISSR